MLDDDENSWVTQLRWWPLDELVSTSEQLTPLSLAAIMQDYLKNGAPNPLPPEEVVVD